MSRPGFAATVGSILVATAVLALPIAMAQAEGPAVSAINGKFSVEGGMTGIEGRSSGIGELNGSITMPLGHAFGLQLDSMLGTSFGAPFGGGTAHLFWRDPAIGLAGPFATLTGGDGERLGWCGAEAELYLRQVTLGIWGGYHTLTADSPAVALSSGFYGAGVTVYPIPNLALTIGATSEFGHVAGGAGIEFQPDLLARRNVSFYVSGEIGAYSSYSITAGVRFYFGPDKPLIRRHREDDPGIPPSLHGLMAPTPPATPSGGYSDLVSLTGGL